MKYSLFFVSLFILSLIACKDKANTTSSTAKEVSKQDPIENNLEDAPLSFENETTYEIARLYLDLKNALVRDNSYSATKIAEILAIKLDKQNASIAKKIVDNEKNIDLQRAAFSTLTTNLTKIFTEQIKGGKLYKQYCPMAFDGEGAFWFSEDEEILNPYFGNKMLQCGEVKEIIKQH